MVKHAMDLSIAKYLSFPQASAHQGCSMYKKRKIALVIPAYNEEKLIKPTLEAVPKTVDRIYVVNDCSTDNMVKVVTAIARRDRRITLISHKQNMGVGQAIITGYKRAAKDGNDIAVVIGGDNQMDLRDLPNFLEPICRGEADYVKGNRFMMNKRSVLGNAFNDMPSKRFFGNAILSLITKFSSGYWKIFDSQDGYTAITKEAIETIDWDRYAWKGYGYVGDWLVLFNVYDLKVKDVPRRAIYLPGERQSQIKIGRYIARVLPRMIARFLWRLKMKYVYRNFHPVVLCYLASFILIPLGAIIGIWMTATRISGGVITGSTAVLTALLIITGFQSLLFAILFDMQLNEKLN